LKNGINPSPNWGFENRDFEYSITKNDFLNLERAYSRKLIEKEQIDVLAFKSVQWLDGFFLLIYEFFKQLEENRFRY